MTKNDFNGIIELTYRKYARNKENITYGFINAENIALVTNALMLAELTDEELGEMWGAVAEYFDRKYCTYDENGNIVGFMPWNEEVEFMRDTKSAWLEVINYEARRRRGE